MHINCPHCHNGFEIVAEDSLKEVDCPSCGSRFSLVADDADRTFSGGHATKTIGRFELVSEIGKGAFGSVWRGKDLQLDRSVAVKIPRKGQLDHAESEQFFREARAAAQLKHPNIVPVHEIGRDGETIYIVSEFVQGVSLADRLTGRPLGMRESAELCLKVARALHHAHENGVIHRDLKPSNIMLDDQCEPHVMDFGLAKREAGEITMTVDGQILGTPAYMSPEQARGSAHEADGRSDVYSVGVILFQLLTGELPFRGNTAMLLHQVINDEAPSPSKLNSNIDRDLATITTKCMEKAPDKRYADANALADDLHRYLDGQAITARPISRVERGWRWCLRNSVASSLSAAVLVTLVTGASISTYFAMERDSALHDLRGKNTELQTARKKVEENLRLANRNADRAKNNAKDARDAVYKYVETVRNSDLLKEERFKDVLKALLRDALTFYEDFVNDPENHAEQDVLADALWEIAWISETSGDIDKAIVAYQRVGEIRLPLFEENPSLNTNLIDLASSYNNMGLLLLERGETNDALVSLKKALELRQHLVAASPTVSEYRSQVAMSHANIGFLCREIGEREDALASFESAREIRQALIVDHPDITEYQRDLANSQYYLGMMYGDVGKRTDAIDSYNNAIEIGEVLSQREPLVIEHQRSLARAYGNIGGMYIRSSRPQDALASFRKAIEILDKLVERDPTVADHYHGLSVNHGNIGNLFAKQLKKDEALKSYKKVMEIDENLVAENPSVIKYKKGLGETYNNIGAVHLRSDDPGEAVVWYDKAIKLRERLAEDNPDLIEVQIDLGHSYVYMGVLASVQNDPITADKYNRLGIDVLMGALKRNPKHPDVRTNLRNAYMGRAWHMHNLQLFDKAVEFWQKAIEYDPDNLAELRKRRDDDAEAARQQKLKTKKEDPIPD